MAVIKTSIWLPSAGVLAIAKGYDSLSLLVQPLLADCDMSTHGWLKLKDVEIEVPPLPSREEALQAALRGLDKEEQELREKFTAELAKLKEQRQNLLALEAPQP